MAQVNLGIKGLVTFNAQRLLDNAPKIAKFELNSPLEPRNLNPKSTASNLSHDSLFRFVLFRYLEAS